MNIKLNAIFLIASITLFSSVSYEVFGQTPEPDQLILNDELEPYKITWTIKNYYPFNQIFPITHEEQEQAVQTAFDFWTKNINAEAIFVKNANPNDVFCTIDFKSLKNIGTGAGNGPNTFCFANIGSNQLLYIDEKWDTRSIQRAMIPLLAHEIGHGLGLGHQKVGSCVMFTQSGGTVLPLNPCKQESEELHALWDGAVCTIPKCLPNLQIVNGAISNFSVDSKDITKGDAVQIEYTIENRGNVDYQSSILIRDFTDQLTYVNSNTDTISAGDSRTDSFIWDTTLASIGTHDFRAILSVEPDEVITSDNTIFLGIEVKEIIPIEPDPEPEPSPIEERVALLEEKVALLEENVTLLELLFSQLEDFVQIFHGSG